MEATCPLHSWAFPPGPPQHGRYQQLRCAPCPAGHNYIGTEHILLGLLREGEGVASRVLETLGADPQKIRTQVGQGACRLSRGVCLAARPAQPASQPACACSPSLHKSRLVAPARHAQLKGLRAARRLRSPFPAPLQVIRMVGESQEPVGSAVGGGSSGSNKMPTLEEYGTNLTQQAEEGKLDPVVGRKKEIERVTQASSRRGRQQAGNSGAVA